MILLQYRFPDNEELVYQVVIDSVKKILDSPRPDDVGEEEHDILEMKIREKIQSVNPDGNYLLRMVTEPVRLVRDDEEEPIPKTEQTIDLIMTPFGEIVWSSVPSPASQPSYPPRGLRVGETWQQEGRFMTPFYTQPLSLHLDYELKGIEEFQGSPCARVAMRADEQSFSFPNNVTQKMRVEGANLFDHENGCLLRSDVSLYIELENETERVSNIIQTHVEIEKGSLSITA